jgi:hypothetical protein
MCMYYALIKLPINIMVREGDGDTKRLEKGNPKGT